MLRTVSALPVASSERRRSETPERSMRSRRRCLKPMFESEAAMRFPSPARRRSSLPGPVERTPPLQPLLGTARLDAGLIVDFRRGRYKPSLT